MFIDLPAAVLLLTPVFVPLANAIGMDLTQLGIMMIVNLAIGLYTPPVGTTLFITSAIAKVKVGETVRELGPFYAWPSWCCCSCPTCRPRSSSDPILQGENPMTTTTNQLARLAQRAYRIRRYALRMGEVQGQGYIGQALGWADVLAVAYGHAMNLRPDEPEWEGRDRFLLSHGHYAIAHYAALIEAGIIPESELETYGSDDSRLPMSGMATYTPGMEISGGSLGQGLAIGVGMALGLKQKKQPGLRLQLDVRRRARRGLHLGGGDGRRAPRPRQPDLPGRHQQPAGRRPVGQGARLRAAGRQVGRVRLARAARRTATTWPPCSPRSTRARTLEATPSRA